MSDQQYPAWAVPAGAPTDPASAWARPAPPSPASWGSPFTPSAPPHPAPPHDASAAAYGVSAEALSAARRQLASEGWRAVCIGLFMVVGGLIATVVSVSMATGGGLYIVWWGPVVFGGIRIVKGCRALIASGSR
jgi:hypothetical protein